MDGFKRLKGAINDLIDEVPNNIENTRKHPLVNKVVDHYKKQQWSKEVRVRMREAGEVFFTEVFIIPTSTEGLSIKDRNQSNTVLRRERHHRCRRMLVRRPTRAAELP